MIEIKSPNELSATKLIQNHTVFLAGSIEMGVAEDWQSKLKAMLSDTKRLILFNPRRDDWDSSWVQEISNPQFNEQVSWELYHLDMTDTQVFYFDPNTKSPITLMELGLIAGLCMTSDKPRNVVVCCPRGFWRRGNVEILCERAGIEFVDTLEEVAAFVKYVL